MHADRGVAGAGPARDEADRGLAGELAVGLGHEGRAGLVPAGHQLDLRRVEQRVENAEKALARQAEHRVHAVPEQRVHHDPAAVADWKIAMHEKPYPRGFRRRRT